MILVRLKLILKNDIFTNHMFTQSGQKHSWFKHTKDEIYYGIKTIGIGGGGGVEGVNKQNQLDTQSRQFSNFFVYSRLVYKK